MGITERHVLLVLWGNRASRDLGELKNKGKGEVRKKVMKIKVYLISGG